MEFFNKRLIKSFQYSTLKSNRDGHKVMSINGRTYIKCGVYQAVTLVGNLYSVYDPSVKQYKHILHVGVTRQHPDDLVTDKKLAVEMAATNAFIAPAITMEVGPNFDKYVWEDLCHVYINSLNLEFVKTREEKHSYSI